MKRYIQEVTLKSGLSGLILFCCLYVSSAQCADALNPKQFLLEQVLNAEAQLKDEQVSQSLYRLELIAPNDPEVIDARLRLALRQGNLKLAMQQLDKLKRYAPNSEIYRKAQINISLSQPQAQQKLQQAKLLSLTGNYTEAKKLYDTLFQGTPPTPALGVEYWTMIAKIPGQEQLAFQQLLAIYQSLKIDTVPQTSIPASSWQNSLRDSLARLLVAQGDKALKAGNLTVAEQRYQQSYALNHSYYFALIGLADVAFARKNFPVAEQFYKKANQIDPNATIAIYGIISVYKRQSPQKALDYLNSMSPDKQLRLKATKISLQSSVFQQRAEKNVAQNQWSSALQNYLQAQVLDPDNPWLIYQLGIVMSHLGQANRADTMFRELLSRKGADPSAIHAYAQFLSSTNHPAQAIAVLGRLPAKAWTSSMRSLSLRLAKGKTTSAGAAPKPLTKEEQIAAQEKERLEKEKKQIEEEQARIKKIEEAAIKRAEKLWDNKNHPAAVAMLKRQPQTLNVMLQIGDWLQQDDHFSEALTYYQKASKLEPQNEDARLGKIETLVALLRLSEARALLTTINDMKSLSLNQQRKIANAWIATGGLIRGNEILQRIKPLAAGKPPSQETALIFRDAARLERQLERYDAAQTDFRQAMIHSNITSLYPADDITYTYLTRNHRDDDWLKRGIRSDAANLFRQQETRFTMEYDYWTLDGTDGFSNFTAGDAILQVDTPLSDGRFFIRGDALNLSAGNFLLDANGAYFNRFGTCNEFGCNTDIAQRALGYNGIIGWQNQNWSLDVGNSPAGFPVSNWLGGINYSGENIAGIIGWRAGLARRPVANSLLSFSGTRDPYTGLTWGGVVATGPNLSLSYDRGEAHGVWLYLGAESLNGQNVADNLRIRLMDGYYYKLINEDNTRATIGVTNMLWHYQKDLSGYTLGQGGYFSPQGYLSFSFPLDFRQRTENWSYEVGGSISWSYTIDNGILLYPLPNLLPPEIAAQNRWIDGTNGSGLGFTFLALVERRLSSHFTLGAVFDLQRTTDYTPSHASLYLRYSLEGWEGDLDMPIRPLVPFANFG